MAKLNYQIGDVFVATKTIVGKGLSPLIRGSLYIITYVSSNSDTTIPYRVGEIRNEEHFRWMTVEEMESHLAPVISVSDMRDLALEVLNQQ